MDEEGWEFPAIADVLGPSPTIALLLYLHDCGPIGIEKARNLGIVSNAPYYRITPVLEKHGLIELDKSRQIPGKPYKLTPLGHKVAGKLKDIENLLE